jgi:hypothetical protein
LAVGRLLGSLKRAVVGLYFLVELVFFFLLPAIFICAGQLLAFLFWWGSHFEFELRFPLNWVAGLALLV